MTAVTLHAPTRQDFAKTAERVRRDPGYGAFLLLRVGFTVLPIVFGVDKFTNILVQWDHYLAPWIVRIVPTTAHQTMLIVGVIEIIAGWPSPSSPGTAPCWSLPGLAGSSSTCSAIPASTTSPCATSA
jgi:hypothetical protein